MPIEIARRRGLSLVELLVVVALTGLVGSIIAGTLSRQQRFYGDAAEVGFVRESVRDAIDVLSTDIRQMSAADTVRLRADSAIEFFSTIGSSVVCKLDGNEIGLPIVRTSGNSLGAALTQPDTGDLAAFYSDSGSNGGKWERHRILGVDSRSVASSCPISSGFSTQSDVEAGTTSLVLVLASAVSSPVHPGRPVRFLRRGRYSLYHASDGDWYLGYRRCNAIGPSVCGATQPISGPYRSYSANAQTSGLVFEYFDSTGQRLGPTASPFALARVDITARGERRNRFSTSGVSGRVSDSATVAVAIRNRVR
ncbi:MAG: prepilin-type N-terminal cleavage/methylation domain-containing protein [Gemmatimonadaceae bacterium]